MNIILPTLYSRSSKGAVQEWTIEVKDNAFRTIAGQKDGSLVTTDWSICTGKNIGKKNETSPQEQALAEAKARWKKKTETGSTEDINAIDTCMSYVEPMLAKDFDEYINKINFKNGLLVQNKYNGVRCVATFENGKVILKSRKGKPWLSVPHINDDLLSFFKVHPNAILDGELFNEELKQKLNELISLVRQTVDITKEDFNKSKQIVRFYIYDGYDFDNLDKDSPYLSRKNWIDKNLPNYCNYYKKVKTEAVTSLSEIEEFYNTILANEGEGAIIRFPYSSYENKRSKNLLKYKPEDDDEGVISAIKEGSADWAGTAKTATILWKGKEFDATFKGTYEQGVERLRNKDWWIGKTITFLYTGLTAYGIPNYARIDPDNCFKGDR